MPHDPNGAPEVRLTEAQWGMLRRLSEHEVRTGLGLPCRDMDQRLHGALFKAGMIAINGWKNAYYTSPAGRQALATQERGHGG